MRETKTPKFSHNFLTALSNSRAAQAIEADLDAHEFTLRDELWRLDDLYAKNPNLVSSLLSLGVDSLHGTTSFNLESIFEHGLLPKAAFTKLGAIALGAEHHSDANNDRETTHLVFLSRPGELIRYAEERANDNSKFGYVTPRNASNFVQEDIGAIDSMPEGNLKWHILGAHNEAQWLLELLASESNVSSDLFPVVIGTDTRKIPPATPIKLVSRSFVKTDIAVQGSIPTSAIQCIFIPNNIRDQVNLNGLPVPVFSLDDLRQLDAKEYSFAKNAENSKGY